MPEASGVAIDAVSVFIRCFRSPFLAHAAIHLVRSKRPSNLQPFGQEVNADEDAYNRSQPSSIAVAARNHFPAPISRLIIEATVSAVWAGHWFEEVAGSVWDQTTGH